MNVFWQSLVCSLIGFTFWRSPARKFYVVDSQQLRGKAHRPTPVTTASNSQEDEQTVVGTVNALRRDIQALQACMWGMSANFLSALKQSLMDCLKCKICQSSPFTLPIILAKCCSNILGCQTCMDAWFSGPEALTKVCPICKCDRGYANTLRLHGIDELLDTSKLLDNAEEWRGPVASTKAQPKI